MPCAGCERKHDGMHIECLDIDAFLWAQPAIPLHCSVMHVVSSQLPFCIPPKTNDSEEQETEHRPCSWVDGWEIVRLIVPLPEICYLLVMEKMYIVMLVLSILIIVFTFLYSIVIYINILCIVWNFWFVFVICMHWYSILMFKLYIVAIIHFEKNYFYVDIFIVI